MGTSKSLAPGSGGAWTRLKRDITGHFTGSIRKSFGSVVGNAVRAADGLGIGGRRVGRGGGGAAGSSARGSIGRVVGGLGGFAEAVRDRGLADGLETLGLGELEGKSAIEIIATVADHLASAVEGLDGELMREALREGIIEAAALGDSDGYTDLEGGLQSFLRDEGVDGLVEIFLCKFVFDAVWANFEDHAQAKATDRNALEAFVNAIDGVCASEVRGVLGDMRDRGEFTTMDWFGQDGQRVGREIFVTIEARLRAMGDA